MQVRVLGTVEIIAADGTTVDLGSPKLRRLLAALLVNAGAVVSVDRLADIVWGDDQPANATGALHNLMSRLRRRIPSEDAPPTLVVHTRAPGYVLELADGALDAQRFERLAEDARSVLASRPDAAAALLDEALALWRGDAYAEFRDDLFARGEAARLDELHAAAQEDRVEVSLRRGQHHEAVTRLELLTARQPLRERPHAQLMLALYGSGRQADALAVYRRYHARVAEELGLEPSDDLRALEERILRNDPELGRPVVTPAPAPSGSPGGSTPPAQTPAPVHPGTVRAEHDAGSVHPDAVASRQDHAPGPDGQTASRRPGTTSSAPAGNRPPAPELIGRAALVATVVDALSVDRIVSLVGPGGVGKTSLALRVAAECGPAHGDGTWWCELASVETDAAVADLTMTVLRAQPRQGMSVNASVVDVLRHQSALLVLDNAEHVAGGVATLVEAIARSCPDVDVLVTSRERLGLATEHVVTVPPLPVPEPDGPADAGTAAAVPAVALFARRAAAVADGFELTAANVADVAEICRRLDGVPLALELAATRMRSMSPADLVDRLSWRFRVLRGGRRGGVERHRTLRAVVDWSYDLLGAEARLVFERLSVFAATFTLDAAEQVVASVADDIDPLDVADVLAELVDASMVVATTAGGPADYTLLETLRAYGRERLEARGEMTAARRAHAHYYTALAVDVSERLYDPDSPVEAAVLDRAIDELRAAHAWSMHNAIEEALTLVSALAVYVEQRALGEAFSWAERTIEQVERIGLDSPGLPGAYGTAALSARFRGDLERAEELAQRGLRAADDPNDPAGYVALYTLAEVALYEGRLEDARRITERMEQLPVSGEHRMFAIWAWVNAILSRAYAGENEVAVELVEGRLRAARRDNDGVAIAWAMFTLAETLVDVAPERALPVAEEALARGRALDERFLIAVAIVTTASLHARHGNPATAVSLFLETIERWRRAGNWTQQWIAVRNVLGLLVRLGADEDAAVLHGALRTRTTAAAPYGTDAERMDTAAAALNERLGTDRVAAARRRGAEMSDDDVIVWVREVLNRLAAGAAHGSDRAGSQPADARG